MSTVVVCLKFICEGAWTCLGKVTLFIYSQLIKIKQSDPENFELDINNINSDLIMYEDVEIGNLYSSNYIPFYLVIIKKLKDGKQLIWESEKSELRMVTVICRKASRYLMWIIDSEGSNHYFILKDDSWQSISKEEYLNNKKELRSSIPIKEDIVVNTAVNTPNKKFDVWEYETCTTNQIVFVPRQGYRANTVMYGNDRIWESLNNPHGMTVGILLLSYGKPKLFNMLIEGETNEYLYFKKDYEWVEIDRQEFRRMSEYYRSWSPFKQILDTQDTISTIIKKRYYLKG